MIGAERLRACVGLDDLIEPVSRALQMASAGRAATGLIIMYPHANRSCGDVFVKTGTLEGAPIHVVKIAPWFAENIDRGEPQGGLWAVLDSATGRTRALLDDQHYLSDIRTAAAGALAARVLAPPIVRTAGVLGSGVQAWWQTIALYWERPFEKLLLWARDRSKAGHLATRIHCRLPEVTIKIFDEAEAVVRHSDVLITATGSRNPIVRGAWLHPGQHITAVGADDPSKCELDAAALNRARVFADGIDEAIANGDIHRAISEGDYAPSALRADLGAVLGGKSQGRTSIDDITIAKLVGIGAQDVAAAIVALEKCGGYDAFDGGDD